VAGRGRLPSDGERMAKQHVELTGSAVGTSPTRQADAIAIDFKTMSTAAPCEKDICSKSGEFR
jgi:hypothetical protein